MVAPWNLLAAASQKQALEYRLQFLWAGLALAGSLLLMALMISWVKHVRRRRSSERMASSDQLAHFRTLYEEGVMDAEEFARVRGLLLGQVKKELDQPAESQGEVNPPSPPTPGSLIKPHSNGNGEPRPPAPPPVEDRPTS